MLGGLFYSIPFARYIFPGPAILNFLSAVALFLVLAIPTMFLVLLLIRFLTKYSAPRNIRRSLGGIWLFSACAAILFGVNMGRAFSVEEDFTESSVLQIPSDTLTVDVKPSPFKSPWRSFDDLTLGDDGLYLTHARIGFTKSQDGQFRVEKELMARGKNTKAAKRNLEAIDAPMKIEGSEITINNYVKLPKSAKVRDQWVKYTFYIPEGKYVNIQGSIYRLSSLQLKPDTRHPNRVSDHVWLMTPEGMLSPAFVDQYNYSVTPEINGFTEIRAEGRIDVQITGSKSHKITLTGKKENVEDVSLEVAGDVLLINYEGEYASVPVRVEVSTPLLKQLDARDLHDLDLKGLSQKELVLNIEGSLDVDALLEVDQLTLTKSGRGEFELRGKGVQVDAMLKNGASLDSKQYKMNSAKISGGNYWRAYLPQIDTLYTGQEDLRSIRFEGREPVIITD